MIDVGNSIFSARDAYTSIKDGIRTSVLCNVYMLVCLNH